MKTEAIREALAFMRRAGVDGSTGFVLAEAEKELDALALRKVDEQTALRDTFAAAALTALLSRGWGLTDSTACTVYEMADAMLAAREGK